MRRFLSVPLLVVSVLLFASSCSKGVDSKPSADKPVELTWWISRGDVQKAHATQLDLVCPYREDQHVALINGLAGGNVRRAVLERSATRILAMVRGNTVMESS